MNLQDLPNEILVNLIDKYLNLSDVLNLTYTCMRFYQLVNNYDLWSKYTKSLPIIDSKNDLTMNRNIRHKLESFLRWQTNKFKRKLFYSFEERMLPHLQFDSSQNQLYITDANELVCLNLNEIRKHIPTNQQGLRLNQTKDQYNRRQLKKALTKPINSIQINEKFKIFEQNEDITSFIKKENFVLNISKHKLSLHELPSPSSNNTLSELFRIEENLINCADFIPNNKLVYGCSDGSIRMLDLIEDNNNNLIKVLNIPDRILRCVVSPLNNNLAIGTAGIHPLPVRVYDLERFKEINVLKPFNNKPYKHGAGVLALSYIDENTLMAAGYDTFIRIFDLRSNDCVQELEEPEDMSIYCVCVSKFNGLLSGNDRQSIIRYFDRRKNRLISTYRASNSNSSIYSLDCSSECIFAGWDCGITFIDFK